MIFPANVISHTLPQVAVTMQDSGVPPLTYSQIKNSLGSYVYNLLGFYMYSTNRNQLQGAIKYTRYDTNGNQESKSIITTLDPNQIELAIIKDLKDSNSYFIINGNSNFITTILAQTNVQLRLYTKRLTSGFGANLLSFKEMEKIFNKPNFFDNYGGDIDEIVKSNREIEKTASLSKLSADGENETEVQFISGIPAEDLQSSVILVAAVSAAIYLIVKD